MAKPREDSKRPPLYVASLALSAVLSALASIASLFAPPSDSALLAFGGTLGLLICCLGLIDGAPPEPTEDD